MSNNFKRFSNKTVIVTGSSRGIGKATAIKFAAEGANVVINYNSSKTQAESTYEEIRKKGTNVLLVKCDVSDEIEVKNMINKTIEVFGGIDILINNAGIVKDVPLLDRVSTDWLRTLEVNLLGQYLCAKFASKFMLDNNGGKIVNISSTSATYSICPEIADYDASKAGVISLTKNLSKALAPKIQVNAVAPGWVNTDINKDLSEEFISKEKENIYLKRFADPNEIADVILFLSSDQSNYITGSTIVVDGGHD